MEIFTAAILALAVFVVSTEEPEKPYVVTEAPTESVTFQLLVEVVDELPEDMAARATFPDDRSWCIIEVLPEHYSHECLGHELRHCIEGHWHIPDEKVPCGLD